MPIIVNVDVMLAKRKMPSGELAEKIGITAANMSILKTGKAKAIRFSTLNAICKALDCQPGDILEYRPGPDDEELEEDEKFNHMKRIIAILLSFAPLFAFAQEHQIIGGYLLDGEDSFEELDAAVVTDAKRKDKNLDGKGMKLPGVIMMMNPESVGQEIGSIIEVKHPFLVKSICFTVKENRMEGCKARINIYRVTDSNNLDNIVTMPIYQEIPRTEKKTTFSIAPEENLELQPGEYYISFALSDISEAIEAKWVNSKTWDGKERYANQLEDCIYFPVYVKSSYSRKNTDSPLTKWKYNIGMSVRGKILD